MITMLKINKPAVAYDMLFTMDQSPMSCHTQDLLEAAIVQKRRLRITCLSEGEPIIYDKALPVDINNENGIEQLIILTTDNEGGILKLSINTSEILAFSALDSKTPLINYVRQ